MDLLNKTLNSFSTQISDGGVSLNFDIFEANLINLAILDGGLFYLLSGALSESLSERQQKILGAIQESEEKLQEASTRLNEGETKLAQAQIVIESIQKDAEQTAAQVKSSILTDGKTEIERLTSNAKAQITTI
jgi:F-type H+-transporting ATPase subunit b